jgi:hypothetical protein
MNRILKDIVPYEQDLIVKHPLFSFFWLHPVNFQNFNCFF